jgi:hypothetical protein
MNFERNIRHKNVCTTSPRLHVALNFWLVIVQSKFFLFPLTHCSCSEGAQDRMQDSSSLLWGDDNTNSLDNNHDDVKWAELAGASFLHPVSAPPQLQHLPAPTPTPLSHAPSFLQYNPLPAAASSSGATQPSFGSLTTPTTPNDHPMPAQVSSTSSSSSLPDAFRFTPEYHAYYYSQRPLDPRLPLPLFETPRSWIPPSSSSGSSSGIIAPAPSNPTALRHPHAQTSSLASLLLSSQDNDDMEPSHQASSSEYRLGPATWKSPLEMIQSDFPRTSSPMFNPLNSGSSSTNGPANSGSSRFATSGGLSFGTSVIGNANERRYSLDGGDSLRRAGSSSSLADQMNSLSIHDKAANESQILNGNGSDHMVPVLGLRSISPMLGGLSRATQPIGPSYANHNGDSWNSKPQVAPVSSGGSRYGKELPELKSGYKSAAASSSEEWEHHENSKSTSRAGARQPASNSRGERKSNKKRGTTPTNHPAPVESNSPRSELLQELRLGKNGQTTVKIQEVIDRKLVQEFATDQNGSRFIQQSLETANAEEKQALFEQLEPVTLRLCVDVFGNYVIQKFFEFGLPQHRRILAEKLVGNVLPLALQMYGCRVIQKALEVISEDQQILLVQELEGHVIKCVKDQNGNHVVQKCIEKVPPQHIDFIVHAFKGQVYSLSTHSYGCRVVQRLLEYCADEQKVFFQCFSSSHWF